ncbi:protein unc-80 homolog [Sinocyclocheilus anshuiensis]|uniref:protein unc-80 homolog n=1 Tax=Sinocyclocheilus anshuiensis TaxID=1608454 RepID=UPI0007B90DAB|nr:PREDICTED: protein unc-80 homolog [Sinocyclocheilus anshuiensis]
MVKRKSLDDSDQENCRGIPFPIQTFLWRQTSAFLRPKLGKQYEASCVSFERVLVENKLHGLSPALTEAIQSISRWELVQAALPHVLHCTAILLSNRRFVFLFAPLISRIKESDLTFRLAGGLVIWQPMWEHRHPDVPAFSALVKPMRNIITAKRNSLVNNQCSPHDTSNPCPAVVCESVRPDSSSPSATGQSCRRGNSVEKGGSSQQAINILINAVAIMK